MIKCPKCGKLVSLRFPLHDCIVRQRKIKAKGVGTPPKEK